MAAIGTMTVTGASGEAYEFSVYPWDTVFKRVGVVYFIAKRISKMDGDTEYSQVYLTSHLKNADYVQGQGASR